MSLLVDAHARVVRYVRLSLTERCNLACTYCTPESHEALPADWLDDEEVVALVAALQPLGVTHLRLTGGEPTLRPRLPQLVERLVAIGLTELSLTTNATRLRALARPLRDAGLSRVNVSLDTLDADRFAAITGGALAPVLDGIDALVAAGFGNGKLNVVALRGVNDHELSALARFAFDRTLTPRFIELMPMSDGAVAPRARFLSMAEVRGVLEAQLGPLASAPGPQGMGPARYVTTSEGRAVGFISAVSDPFCATCNRVRISARGRLHTCLGIDDPLPGGSPDPLDLRAALRRGPDVLRATVRDAVSSKRAGHTFDVAAGADRLFGGPRRHMLVIGG